MSKQPIRNQTVRTSNELNLTGGPGPYIARVISHLDQKFMGSLQVQLIKTAITGETPDVEPETLIVNYASPFFGVTQLDAVKPEDGYRNTQKSYGFWAVPPDVGTKVLVMFVEGRRDMGYWFACIPDEYMNFMVPDPRASTENTTNATPEELKGSKLPVGEYNKLIVQTNTNQPNLYPRPYNNDFTQVLEVQGLLFDEARGTTTSSSRREVPSAVYGWSTPGPLDKRVQNPQGKRGVVGKEVFAPANRLGGSSIVMDDGDDKLIRRTHAADGPPFYVNKEAGETGGDETIPQNECIRIRTRTGHQILLHNSEDLIYIANSRGTAWIELTSDGKIDIHADDSISIMTDQDLNITAERDINMEAGRNVNIKAAARWSDGRPQMNGKRSGQVHIESEYDMNFVSGTTSTFDFKEGFDLTTTKEIKLTSPLDINIKSDSNINIEAAGSVHEQAGQSWYRKAKSNIVDIIGGAYYTQADGPIHITAGEDIFESTPGIKHAKANEMKYQTGGSLVNFFGGGISFDSPAIDLNSGISTAPADAVRPVAGNSPNFATPAINGKKLPTYTLPYNLPGGNQPVPYESILCRAPQREPWTQHENMNPHAFKPDETDREGPGELPSVDRIITPDTFLNNTSGRKSSEIVANSGGLGFGSAGDGGVYSRGADSLVVPPGAEQGPLATIKTKRKGLTTQVAAVFAPMFQGFIDDLETQGNYTINLLGGYSFRKTVSGSGWSYHASGAAIDINWPNPVWNTAPNGYFPVRPPNAPVTDMPVEIVRQLCKKWGLGWGGDWKSADDAMHFSAARREGGSYDIPANGIIPTGVKDTGVLFVPDTKTDDSRTTTTGPQ